MDQTYLIGGCVASILGILCGCIAVYKLLPLYRRIQLDRDSKVTFEDMKWGISFAAAALVLVGIGALAVAMHWNRYAP